MSWGADIEWMTERTGVTQSLMMSDGKDTKNCFDSNYSRIPRSHCAHFPRPRQHTTSLQLGKVGGIFLRVWATVQRAVFVSSSNYIRISRCEARHGHARHEATLWRQSGSLKSGPLGLSFAAWSCNWWSRGAFSELRALSDQHVLFQVDKDFMVRTWISSVQNWIEVDIAFGCTTLCAMAASDSWTLCLGAMSCFNFQIIGYLQRPFLSILCHPFLAFLDLFISSPKSPCQFAQGGHALWMWTGCCRVFVLCLHGVVTMHILRMYSNDRGFFGHVSLWLNLNETLGITLKVVTWSSDVFGMWT